MITLFMEFWMAFWSWMTGRPPADHPYLVWDILWRDGGEWYARPAGQHRQGFSVERVMAEVKRRDREAARLKASERYRLSRLDQGTAHQAVNHVARRRQAVWA